MRSLFIIALVIRTCLTLTIPEQNMHPTEKERICRTRLFEDNCLEPGPAMPDGYGPKWFYNITQEKCLTIKRRCWDFENSFNTEGDCVEICHGVSVPVCPAEMVDGVVDPANITVWLIGYGVNRELPSNESYFNQTVALPDPGKYNDPFHFTYTIASVVKPLIKSIHFDIIADTYAVSTADNYSSYPEVRWAKTDDLTVVTPVRVTVPSYPAYKVKIEITARQPFDRHKLAPPMFVSGVTIAACYAPVKRTTSTTTAPTSTTPSTTTSTTTSPTSTTPSTTTSTSTAPTTTTARKTTSTTTAPTTTTPKKTTSTTTAPTTTTPNKTTSTTTAPTITTPKKTTSTTTAPTSTTPSTTTSTSTAPTTTTARKTTSTTTAPTSTTPKTTTSTTTVGTKASELFAPVANYLVVVSICSLCFVLIVTVLVVGIRHI